MLAHDLPTCGRSARDLAEGLVVTNGRSSAHSLPQPQGLPRVWTGGSAQDRVTARSVSALRRCSPTTNCGYARAVRRAVAGPAGRIPGPARDRRGRAPGPRPARRPPPGCLTQVATSTWTRPVTAACWAHLQGMEAGACSARQERGGHGLVKVPMTEDEVQGAAGRRGPADGGARARTGRNMADELLRQVPGPHPCLSVGWLISVSAACAQGLRRFGRRRLADVHDSLDGGHTRRPSGRGLCLDSTAGA